MVKYILYVEYMSQQCILIIYKISHLQSKVSPRCGLTRVN